MIIEHEKHISFRCPECGLGNCKPISIFSLAGSSPLEIQCEHCHNTCVTVARKADKLLFSVLCVACMEWHSFTASQKFFWGQKLTSFRCTVTGFGILCIGKEDAVREAQSVYDDEMLDILGELEAEINVAPEGEEYSQLDNEEVMFAVVDKLYMLSKLEKVMCPCGSQDILFDILNDCVHIFCENCGRDKVVMALTEEDLEAMMQVEQIILEGHEDE